jgi:beta-lactam-binding protein with PASTA domain
VPNLVGQAESAAGPALTAADCVAGTTTKKPTTKASEVGKVISTEPPADATAIPGTAVNVTVGVASGCKKAKKKKGKKGVAAAKKKKKKGCGKKKKKKK